jgi:DNA-binding transcriptional LysR family regulator
MEMHQVRYFLAVARTRNFTRAAEECHVSQPSLTRAIQKLEGELGGPLFRREHSLSHLTDLGRIMLPHLEQTYGAAQAAKALAEGVKKGSLTPLSLGVTSSFAPDHLVDTLERMNRSLKGFELTLASAAHADLVRDMMHGDFDVAILEETGDLPERLRSWQLFRESYRVLCRTDHRFAQLNAIEPAQLDGEIWIDRPNCLSSQRFHQHCALAGVKPVFRHRATSEEHLQRMVLAGLGCALSPESAPLSDGLTMRPIHDLDLGRTLLVATVIGRRASFASDAFVRATRARPWPQNSEQPAADRTKAAD